MKLRDAPFLKKPERLFLIVGGFFGLLSVFMMPILTIPDEGAHFWMSYGMFTKNQQIPQSLLVSADEVVDYVDDGTYFEKVYQTKADLEGDSFKFNLSKQILINDSNETRPVSSLDIARLPQAIGVAIGSAVYPSLGVMIILGRLLNLAIFIGVIYLIIKRVNYGKLAIAFLALFPMLIHQAGSLSYDVINAVIIFAWIALLINLFSQKTAITKKQLIVLVILALALIFTKLNNALLLIFLLFLPFKLYRNIPVLKKLETIKVPKINKKVLWPLISLTAAVGFVIFLYVFDKYLASYHISSVTFMNVAFNTFFRPEINTLLDPIVTTGIVGNFGWLWYRLPEWLVFIHLAVFGLILLGEKTPKVSAKFALVSLMMFAISIAVITLGMYFWWTLEPQVAGPGAEFIQGMQGRYFTPLLILLIPTFAYLQKYIQVKIDQTLLTVIALTTSVVSLTTYLVLTYYFFYL